MPDTTARLLSLLSLLQTPRLWPGSELARRLQVSGRTVRRDIDRLRDIGYPVEAVAGGQGGYRLVAGSAMPPLLLEDEEAVAIAVGLATIAGQAVSGLDEPAVRATAKLAQVLPARLRRRVSALVATTLPVVMTPGAPVSPDSLVAITAAGANHERMRFRYRSHDGTTTARHVEPVRLVAGGRRWYLLAFDLDRDDWRTFRVDRMTDLRATGARARQRTPPPEGVEEFLRTRMLAMAPTFRADVTLHAPRDVIAARLGSHLGDGVLQGEDRADDQGEDQADVASCRWHSHPDTVEWLATRLLALDTDFQVHGPPELLDHLDTMAARITRSRRLGLGRVGQPGQPGQPARSPRSARSARSARPGQRDQAQAQAEVP
ncbi:YafY family transcriptional regulator [Catenulispora sp. NL8]|uniref:YafY family transcriptional regulator n=1 Tax=Catenulispora pinistramenti TaxID=2705254 RepID=A0ABS5KUJ5_9ACTN|nr:YafY family protein [Catenulispora pinistramenti]MBS2549710.1 YafY family transcriptional regulator [Catenulispora pinistramenti]